LALSGDQENAIDAKNETTYFKDTLSKRFVRKSEKKNVKQQGLSDAKSTDKGDSSKEKSIPKETDDTQSSNQKKHVHQEDDETDYVGLQPNDHVEVLKLQVKALRAQIEEQNKLHEETLNNLMQDRQYRIDEAAIRRKRDETKIEQLNQKNKKTGGIFKRKYKRAFTE